MQGAGQRGKAGKGQDGNREKCGGRERVGYVLSHPWLPRERLVLVDDKAEVVDFAGSCVSVEGLRC